MTRMKKVQLESAVTKLRTVKVNYMKASLIFLSLMFVGASGAAVYTYTLYQNTQKEVLSLKTNKDSAKQETQKTIDAVAKHIVLPKGETPTIATVTDSKKLKNQPFFSKASNGDKVLIYTKSKKAILFNPTQNKVVEVAPINLGKNAKSDVVGAAMQPTPTQVVQQVQVPQQNFRQQTRTIPSPAISPEVIR